MTKRTIKERVEYALTVADTAETQAAAWIKENPHMAVLYARHAHLSGGWHVGCKCELEILENWKNKETDIKCSLQENNQCQQ